MNSLTTAINTSISQAINELADRMASHFSIEKSEILSLWNEHAESSVNVSETAASTPAPKKPAAPRKKAAASVDEKKCEHVFVKGKNPGSLCGRKVCDESTTGKYCKNHLVNETKSEETTKKPAAPKKVSASKKEAKEVETPVVKQLQEEVPVYKVKLNKWRNYEHQGTGLLFDRKTSEVYGRQQADGSVAGLTADDILTCKKLGVSFRMPENIVSNNDEEKQEEEEVELEEEEEEEVEEEEEDN